MLTIRGKTNDQTQDVVMTLDNGEVSCNLPEVKQLLDAHFSRFTGMIANQDFGTDISNPRVFLEMCLSSFRVDTDTVPWEEMPPLMPIPEGATS